MTAWRYIFDWLADDESGALKPFFGEVMGNLVLAYERKLQFPASDVYSKVCCGVLSQCVTGACRKSTISFVFIIAVTWNMMCLNMQPWCMLMRQVI